MGPKKPRSPARALEAGLWLVAFLCLACVVTWKVEARQADRAANAIVEHTAQTQGEASGQASDASDSATRAGTVIGRLSISQLKFSVPVLESYDPATLKRGVGHVPGTAVPGGLGNLVLAGHRDTFFRPLRFVRPGMDIQVATGAGRWSYLIDRTEVVTPDQVSILDVGDRPEMTLITCYPFDYIGAAPKRFIVHAHLISVDATR